MKRDIERPSVVQLLAKLLRRNMASKDLTDQEHKALRELEELGSVSTDVLIEAIESDIE